MPALYGNPTEVSDRNTCGINSDLSRGKIKPHFLLLAVGFGKGLLH
jgi:hypothetical protein